MQSPNKESIRAGKGKAGFFVPRALPFFCLFLRAAFLALPPVPVWAGDDSTLPEIVNLDNRDAVFRQYLEDVELSRRRIFIGRDSPEELAALMTIYSYVTRKGDEIMALAARCNIPYGTIASINGLSHPEDLAEGAAILLPSMPGIFVEERPANDMGRLFAASREGGLDITVDGKKFRFLPGGDLSPTERIYFLNSGFRFPLADFRVSSPYGHRINPVTGKAGIHRGVDLAAPSGTAVSAARDGVVSVTGDDPVLGLYVIITHRDNWVSLYGHLSEITTVLNEELQSGSLIGRVGSTGQSTGPHLHFELRQNGMTRDPGRLLGLFSGSH